MATALDSWQSLYETCQKLDHDLSSNISQQSKYSSAQSQSKLRSEVQEALGRFSLAVLSLRQKLDRNASNLTSGEKRRREAAVSAMENREKQLKLALQKGNLEGNPRKKEIEDRKRLFDSNIIDMGKNIKYYHMSPREKGQYF